MMAEKHAPRVVVTGVGVISPVGIGKENFWRNLIEGRSGIGELRAVPNQALPTKLAAEVRDFNPLDFIYQKKFLKVMSRDVQLGVSAASIAMKDAGLRRGDVDPERMGVEFGCGHISFTPEELAEAARTYQDSTNDENFTRWGESEMGKIAPLWLLRQLPNMPACHVAIEHDARGPNNTITSAEASALLAMQEAIRVINRGQADVMVVGAASSHIHPVDISRICLYEDLSRSDDPLRACRPFDRDRDGAVVGEGSAVFVLERYGHAVARGADIYCEVLGIGAGCDGDGAGAATGAGLVNAIRQSLQKSGLAPRDLGHINAHGKSTRRDDCVESVAYHQAFGAEAEKIPVTALKSYLGSFDAGTGAVELAGSILALRNGRLPMTLNYEHPDPACRRLNVVREPMRLRNSVAMSVNRTIMGQSVAAVLRAV